MINKKMSYAVLAAVLYSEVSCADNNMMKMASEVKEALHYRQPIYHRDSVSSSSSSRSSFGSMSDTSDNYNDYPKEETPEIKLAREVEETEIRRLERLKTKKVEQKSMKVGEKLPPGPKAKLPPVPEKVQSFSMENNQLAPSHNLKINQEIGRDLRSSLSGSSWGKSSVASRGPSMVDNKLVPSRQLKFDQVRNQKFKVGRSSMVSNNSNVRGLESFVKNDKIASIHNLKLNQDIGTDFPSHSKSKSVVFQKGNLSSFSEVHAEKKAGKGLRRSLKKIGTKMENVGTKGKIVLGLLGAVGLGASAFGVHKLIKESPKTAT